MYPVLAKNTFDSHLASATKLENVVPFSQQVNSLNTIHGSVRVEKS